MPLNNKYRVVQGHECLSACLANIIGYKNQEITANTIVILGDGMRVRLNMKENVIETDMYNSNYNFLKENSIRYVKRSVSSEKKAGNLLCDLIEQDIIPIIQVEPKLLTHSRVFMQAVNAVHNINIVGYDDNRFYICDGYVPTRSPSTFEGWVDKEIILEAFRKKNYQYMILTDISSATNKTYSEIIKQKINEGIRAYVQGGYDSDYYYGKDAALKLFSDITEKGCDNTRDNLINANFQIKIYGFLSLKYILGEVLEQFNIDYLPEWNNIILEWNNICLLLLKCGFSNKKELYKLLSDKVTKCTECEIELLNEISYGLRG